MKPICYILFVYLLTCEAQAQTPIRFLHAYGNYAYNYGMCVHQDSDTGYVILANVSGNLGNNNVHLFKIDKYGAVVWSKVYADSALFWGEKMAKTQDGGFIITGYTNKINMAGYDVFLIKTDSLGNKEWERYYGGNDWDFGFDVAQTQNGSFVVCGSTYSFGNGHKDVYVLKISSQGDTLWTRTYGGIDEDEARSINICVNGDILVAGHNKATSQSDYDALLLRFNSNGNLLWYKSYGGTSNEKIYGVFELYNGHIVLGGHTASFGNGGDDYYLIYTDTDGQQLWFRADGGPDDERALTLALTADSAYVLSGLTTGPGYQDLYFYKMKPNGDWNYSTSHGSPYEEYASSIKQTFDGGYIIVGTSTGFGQGVANVLVIKTGIDGLSEPYNSIAEHNVIETISLNIYPNPFTTFINLSFDKPLDENINFRLYDITGREIISFNILKGNSFYNFNTASILKGIYFYECQSQSGYLFYRGKLIGGGTY